VYVLLLLKQDKESRYNLTQDFSCNHCCSGKYYTFRVFVALVTQHAMRMNHIVICGLRTRKYFPTLSHKQHDFRKYVFEHKCVLIFFTTFVRNISHSTKKWAIHDHTCMLVFMWRICYSSQIVTNFEFSRQIFEKNT
jgi:hypothetical protein